jgi:PAS domain S-box-containing protein
MESVGVAATVLVAMALLLYVQHRRHRAEVTRVEAEVRLAQERFRNAFTHATTAMAVLSPDGRYLEVNDALCALLGRPEEQLLQLRFADVRHPDDRDESEAVRDRLLKSDGEAEFVEKRFMRPDGVVVWGRTSVSAIRKPDGTVAYFISLTEDVTAAKEAEKTLQRRQRWFEALVEHASDVICLLDEDGCITWVSPSSISVLGFADTEPIGMHFVDLLHYDDRERVQRSFDQLARRPGPAEPLQFRIRHEDGSWRHFETLATNPRGGDEQSRRQ